MRLKIAVSPVQLWASAPPSDHLGGAKFSSGGMGEWPRGSGRWPVTPEVAGSNPVSPAKSVRMLGVEPGVFFYLNVTFG